MSQPLTIYQAENGAIELQADLDKETVWASLDQISQLFGRDKSVISRHIKNIFLDNELEREATVAFFATVQKEGKRSIKRNIEYFNLDVILSVGYRVNSKVATKFRQWVTLTLKKHIIDGYSINHKVLEQNKARFLETLEELKILTSGQPLLETEDVLSLIQAFSNTWFALDRYDKNKFPKQGNQEEVLLTAKELQNDLQKLKEELIDRGEATNLFAEEKQKGTLEGIFGNVFQTVFGQDAYLSIEEKAAHLLYFVVKNHPFNDGNKRSGAFAFIWLLQKAEYPFRDKITPETLSALTILIAESDPTNKDRMIGIVLLLLKTDFETV